MAEYLLPESSIKFGDQIDFFKLRSRTNKLPSNWAEKISCETGCGPVLRNDHILTCTTFSKPCGENQNINLIYNGNAEEKQNI